NAGECRKPKRRHFDSAFEPQSLGRQQLLVDAIDFCERNDFRFLGKAMAIGFKLAAHSLVGFARVSFPGIDKMQKHAAALDMAQKSVAKPVTLVRAFDQARNIGDNEFPALASGNTELRVNRAEGIGSDLRLCGTNGSKESRFPGIRQPDESDV